MTARAGKNIYPAKQGNLNAPQITPRIQNARNTKQLTFEEKPSKMQQLKLTNSLDPDSYRTIVTTNIPKYVSTTKGNKI